MSIATLNMTDMIKAHPFRSVNIWHSHIERADVDGIINSSIYFILDHCQTAISQALFINQHIWAWITKMKYGASMCEIDTDEVCGL